MKKLTELRKIRIYETKIEQIFICLSLRFHKEFFFAIPVGKLSDQKLKKKISFLNICNITRNIFLIAKLTYTLTFFKEPFHFA